MGLTKARGKNSVSEDEKVVLIEMLVLVSKYLEEPSAQLRFVQTMLQESLLPTVQDPSSPTGLDSQ